MNKGIIRSVYSKRSLYKALAVSMAFSLALLGVRIWHAKSLFYGFLVWNLFLATLPFIISTYLTGLYKPKLLVLACGLMIWLLFLPNAPYIVTDLMHLKWSADTKIWLDVLLVTSFAWNGLILCFLSLFDVHRLLSHRFGSVMANVWIVPILILCGFGVYLGRFLRWNSWDVIQHPQLLFEDIMERVMYPHLHLKTWGMTFGFASFIGLGFWLFREFANSLAPKK